MYIHVKTYAGQRKEEVKRLNEDHLEVRVREPAQNNLANGRVIEIIKNLYPGALARLINGHQSPSKLFSVDGN